MIQLTAPERIVCGTPIPVSYEADERVVGRVRLTSGTDLVPFQLLRGEEETSEPRTAHRLRGRAGAFRLAAWGDHPVGTELVLRFEGAKVWMTVVEQG